MDDQQQSREATRKQILWTVVILAVIVGIVGFAYVREWKWTGLIKDPDFHKRTLWDWLNLLIVPAVLALGGYLFTRSESRRSQETAEKERALDREIADERRQDDMLQAYLDGMSQLLIDKDRPLHRAQAGDSLSTVVRARTLTVLARLEGARKGSVMRFLYESGLISKDRPILDLRECDLSGTNLNEAILRGANLRQAILTGADLKMAILDEADLRDTDLRGADLWHTYLTGANLRDARLTVANLGDARLVGADLRGTYLKGVDLTHADLSNANLREINLSGASLFMASFRGADLMDADLMSTVWSNTSLSDANLRGANLSKANLAEAFLLRADLRWANLSETDLSGADLNKANLTLAKGWTEEQLREAASLEGASMPNGQKYEDWLNNERRGEALDPRAYIFALLKERGGEPGDHVEYVSDLLPGAAILDFANLELEDRGEDGENSGRS